MHQTSGSQVQFKRVLLKISGEALMGDQGYGLHPPTVERIAAEVKTVHDLGAEICMVIGGGNIFRGLQGSAQGMERTTADYMGMLGTVMNALALQDFIEQAGADVRVQTAISMAQVAEPYLPLRAIRHLEKGRIVIFGAGAGLPYFSTDTVAAQRALEIHADEVLVAKNGVDGVYSADPKKDPAAKKLGEISYQEALVQGLKVVDATAFSLCMDNKMPMRVFGMADITKALLGKAIGTKVRA